MAFSLFRSRRSPAKDRITPSPPVPQPVSRRRVRVIRKESVSDRAVLLELQATDSVALEPFAAGAHIDLHIPPGLIRQYSLVDIGRSGDYAICVQREASGRGGSVAVHDRLREGDALTISSPRNTFGMEQSSGRVLLLAAGVGVTPLVSMAAHLHRTGSDFELHAYARSVDALPLHDHLESAPYRDRVFMHDSSLGDSFRTSAPTLLDRPLDGGAVYICGPESFVALARERAKDAGWRPEQVHSERFTQEAEGPMPGGSASFSVIAASTGEEMTVEPDESIADVLERHGYETYRSCGQGYCGSCIARVISGIPDHRDHVQSPEEHAGNSHINVCCSRSLSEVLELDV